MTGGDGDGGCVRLSEQAILATKSTQGGTPWALIIPFTTLSLLLLAGLFFLRRKYRSKKRRAERSASSDRRSSDGSDATSTL